MHTILDAVYIGRGVSGSTFMSLGGKTSKAASPRTHEEYQQLASSSRSARQMQATHYQIIDLFLN